jgi:hypothetical protein
VGVYFVAGAELILSDLALFVINWSVMSEHHPQAVQQQMRFAA